MKSTVAVLLLALVATASSQSINITAVEDLLSGQCMQTISRVARCICQVAKLGVGRP
jgi:hypothetical protein